MNLRLELFVESIERSVEFYRDVLDFTAPTEIEGDYVSVRKEHIVIGLGKMKSLPDDHPLKVLDSGQKIGLGVEIVLVVEDVNALYKRVVSKGYPIQEELTKRSWGLVDFRIMDPDGYYLRITSSN